MNLYIQVESGQPINHPAFENNLIEAFGQVPEHWEPFFRVNQPTLGQYEVFEDPKITYEKIDGVWTDVFHVREMTVDEKTAKDQKENQEKIGAVKRAWAKLPFRNNFSAWVLNEETIKYEPPIPRPTDRDVMWHGPTNSWIDKPPKPDDGKNYALDFDIYNWVEVVPPTQE